MAYRNLRANKDKQGVVSVKVGLVDPHKCMYIHGHFEFQWYERSMEAWTKRGSQQTFCWTLGRNRCSYQALPHNMFHTLHRTLLQMFVSSYRASMGANENVVLVVRPTPVCLGSTCISFVWYLPRLPTTIITNFCPRPPDQTHS